MKKERDMKEKNKMDINNRTASNDINFTDYAPLDQDYSKQELAEIYKRIITDITRNK